MGICRGNVGGNRPLSVLIAPSLRSESTPMHRQLRWILIVLLLPGCGEQQSTPRAVGTDESARSGTDVVVSDGSAAFNTMERKALLKEMGGNYSKMKMSVKLGGVDISNEDLQFLKRMPDVLIVKLDSTPITDDALISVAQLRHLRELHVGNTQVTDSGLQHLSGMTNLRNINLNGTQVTDAALEVLSTLPALRVIELANTQVTKTALDRLKLFNNLKVLTVATGQFEAEDLQKLQAALPEVYINLIQ